MYFTYLWRTKTITNGNKTTDHSPVIKITLDKTKDWPELAKTVFSEDKGLKLRLAWVNKHRIMSCTTVFDSNRMGKVSNLLVTVKLFITAR